MSKKAVIVPGVHDLIPPQGLITVQLTHPDTGRVLKEAKAENAVMNWFLSQVGGFSRGDFLGTDVADFRRGLQPNFNPLSMNIDTLEQRDLITARMNIAGQYPGNYPSGTEVCFLWASSSSITPNAAHTHFPGSDAEGMVTGFARTDLPYTTVGTNLPRGTINPTECRHTYSQSRMVAEWPTTHGAGVYRSIGIGSVAQRGLAYGGGGAACGVPLYYIDGTRRVNGVTSTQRATFYSGQSDAFNSVTWPDHRIFWTTKSGQGIFFNNFQTSMTGATTGPNSATIGGSGQVSVAAHGGQLWVARGTTLKRCDYPTGTSLTVNATYAGVSGFTDPAIWDITSDGTNLYLLGITKVFVVNPATGAVTSSWTHSLPRTGSTEVTNIEWDPAMQHLWLTFEAFSALGVAYGWGQINMTNSGSSSLNTSRSYAYTTAGTRLNYAIPFVPSAFWRNIDTHADAMGGNAWDGSSIARANTGVTGIAQNHGWAYWMSQAAGPTNTTTGNQGFALHGPSMASHALLDADIVKDTSTGLKIIYDYNFTDI